jgi:hypothetical protein
MPANRSAPAHFLSAAIVLLAPGGVLLVLGGGVLDARGVFAADEPDAETVARKKLQQQLASRKSGDRLEALERLRNYPSADMAKLVVSRGLKDRDEEVRLAAENTLLAVKDNDDVCEYLIDMLNKEGRRKGGLEPLYPVYRVLLASSLPDAEDGLLNYFDKSSATLPDAVVAMSDLSEALGKKALPSEFVQLERLTKSKTFEREFGLRRALIRAATRYTTKEAVGFLFRVLDKQKGELRGDVIEYLGQVTGEQHGADVAAWLRWWQEHEKTFEYPQRPAPPLVRNVVMGNASGSYYGIPLYAQRMVFVLDTSASMRGQRIMAAKRDLTSTVMGLDEECFFGLITFNSNVNTWQKTLVQATVKNKKAAALWIENQELAVMTASYDALEAAMRFDAEAIYFLTDGAPVGGRIVAPAEIVYAISHLNRVRRESIYSIGVGVGPEGNPFEAFLKALASENYGIYRRVDE